MHVRFALAAVILVLSSAAAVATAVLLEVKDDVTIFTRAQKHPLVVEEGALDGVDPGGPQTILILGSDRRFVDIANHNPARSDTIILVRLDPSKHATAVMSLPRDLRVNIPDHGIDKINAAYAIGGPELTVRTVRQLLNIPINHVVNMNFGGFQRAVNRLGCVYTDIDRRYFNDNNPPAGGGGRYAVIDIKAGYQKVCGEDALSFVRYRHFDSDLVRGARQQQFLSDARDQIGIGKLFSDRKDLLRIFGSYTQTDIRSPNAIFRLLKLAITSAQNPVQEVRFPGDITGEFVTITPTHLAQIRTRFLNARATTGPRGGSGAKSPSTSTSTKRKKASGGVTLAPGLQPNASIGQDQAVPLATRLGFPVYYPKATLIGASYRTDQNRAYEIYDRDHHRYRAYRIVARIRTTGFDEYYGIQGTDWPDPPILDDPSERRRINRRTVDLYYDGTRLRLVAWRAHGGRYWISNTLLHTLTNRQMLGLARTLSKVN
jgi:LCP family protein required for cell wall assembly